MEFTAKLKPVSGYVLKLIAMITMLIDHTDVAICTRLLMGGYIPAEKAHQFYIMYRVFRGVGRMAFPIYCFLLVEGFRYTRSRSKYAFRLFVFALISELPFDMALYKSYLYWDSQNVYFTLCLGLLTIWAVDEIQNRLTYEAGNPARVLVRGILIMAVAIGSMALAEYGIRSDYGASGIAAILFLYLLREQRAVGFIAAVAALALMSSTLEIAALLMVIPIMAYDGTRGRQTNKYVFYAFYPAHLLILAVICVITGLGITMG